ncbi:unnamed protein product [Chondrus crispus]|uniref:MAT1 centre domain-containing protein n=1 Tax=Chondrus crispus TaxID=2769 RepID=R7QLI7_CHOCR|nr:unnamed protein product [Chondrus crispus]CDF38633.1 unnamed protein product [Chondrus crispus]|eukprot:XP_005718538.1 unnamed protein product [Chondrus crispus]
MTDNFDFEDDSAHLSKDAQTRRRYLRWFNKRRDDFSTDREYDDYLEMVEDIIFNLVNNVDVEETKARVEKYRKENQGSIGQNHAKKGEEDRLEAERVAQLERARIAKLAELRRQDHEEEKRKQQIRREEEAEELLRVSKGDDAVEKLRRKKEKAERKKRKKEAAAAREAEEREKPDFRPMFFRPQFPSPLPVPVDLSKITMDQRPEEDAKAFEARTQAEQAKAATAAGFKQQFVYERALKEFSQSLNVLQL